MTGLDLSPGSPEWRRLVTSSKVPAILGESPYSTPAEVFALMRGDIDHTPIARELQIRGETDETKAVRHFWEVRHPSWEREADGHTWTREDAPWAAANTDSHGIAGGRRVLVEAKSVGRHSRLDEWGEEGTDEVPFDYWAQVMFQMWVSGIGRTYIERVGPFTDEFRTYTVDYSPRHGEALARRLRAFHASLADEANRPAPSSPKDRAVYSKVFREIDDAHEWEIDPDLAAAYIEHDIAAKHHRDELELAKARIMHALGDARFATVNGQRIARRQRTRSAVALYRCTDALDSPQADAA